MRHMLKMQLGKQSIEHKVVIAKLQLNSHSQLHLHSNPTPSPLQVNSTPSRVELELCPIIGLHPPPTHHKTKYKNTLLATCEQGS